MTAHSALGNGFQEVIYQRALEIEMSKAGLIFNREFEMPIFYRNSPTYKFRGKVLEFQKDCITKNTNPKNQINQIHHS